MNALQGEDIVYDPVAIAEQFLHGKVSDILAFGSGNINDTFLVTPAVGGERRFILQRINTRVFREPELIMRNLLVTARHMRQRLDAQPPARRWEVPLPLSTRYDSDHLRGPDGSFWRALTFIEGASSFETIVDDRHAEEVGYALGLFHNLLSDLPAEQLADTLKGFHITPAYLRLYLEASEKYAGPRSAELDYCREFVSRRAAIANILEDARSLGRLLLRPIHGDPKVNNVLIDTETGRAASIIDLDTVKPGLVHYDIGDCLRSCCNLLGEETERWEQVRFEAGICRAVLRGYLPAARQFLTEDDYTYLYDSIRLIAFELGLRFLTDYLDGNVYFKVKGPQHNLSRALVQFRLAESVEAQEDSIRGIIRDLR